VETAITQPLFKHELLARMKFERNIYGDLVRRHVQEGIILSETNFPPYLHIPLHTHDEHAYFSLALRGGYLEIVRNRTYVCGPRVVAFHPSGAAHSNQFFDNEVTTLFTIRLNASMLDKSPADEDILHPSKYVEGGILRHLGLKLFRETRANDSLSNMVIEEVVMQMLGEVSNQTWKADLRKPPAWLATVADIINSQFTQRLALADLASQVGVHKVYLGRVFHQYFKCTIGEYVRFLRVERACQKLSMSGASLLDISLECGFADQSHFSRTFKRVTGLTPLRYKMIFGTN
jgi:AraC family transcriptional regulator